MIVTGLRVEMSKSATAKAELEAKAMTVVPEYMVEQNRPYSAIDVYNNLRQQYGKTLIVKALEHGVSIGVLKEKLIGKQKIFYADQDRLPVADESTIAALDKSIAERSETYASLSAKYKIIQTELASLRSEETTEKLREMVEESKAQVVLLKGRVQLLDVARASAGVDAETEGKSLLAQEAALERVVAKRKRMACDIIDCIRDGVSMPKKQLFDSIGLEIAEGEKV